MTSPFDPSRRDLMRWTAAMSPGAVAPRATAKASYFDGFDRYELTPAASTGERWPVHVYAPKQAVTRKLPAVVLLHGLGETRDPALGVVAWAKLYGALGALRRLKSGHVEPLLPRAGYLRREHQARINQRLSALPFRDLVLVCPATPNPHRPGPAARTLGKFAAWLADGLIPALDAELGQRVDTRRLALGGCSMGGYVAIETMLLRPEPYRAVTLVQNAIGAWRAPDYAAKLRELRDARKLRGEPLALQLVSSSGDPYLEPTRALARALTKQGVAHEVSVAPGPHNQPWLQEIGCIEALWFCERALYASPSTMTRPAAAPRPGTPMKSEG